MTPQMTAMNPCLSLKTSPPRLEASRAPRASEDWVSRPPASHPQAVTRPPAPLSLYVLPQTAMSICESRHLWLPLGPPGKGTCMQGGALWCERSAPRGVQHGRAEEHPRRQARHWSPVLRALQQCAVYDVLIDGRCIHILFIFTALM